MFTGIIRKTAEVKNVKPKKDGMFLEIKDNLGKIKIGESININGVCSTVKISPKKVFGGLRGTVDNSDLLLK